MGKKLTTAEALGKVRAVHGDKYDYPNFQYTNMNTHVDVGCPVHGIFSVTMSNHISKESGCPECGKRRAALSRRNTNAEIIARFRKKHGDKYDYSEVEYVTIHQKVTIICPDHGRFTQTPAAHAHSTGCYECGLNTLRNTFSDNKERFIEKARKAHGDKYNYDKVEYINARTKVVITCPEHGDFAQTPYAHTKKSGRPQGCPDCVRLFSQTRPAILYYLRLNTELGPLYKIGITNKTVSQRYERENISYDVLKVWEYNTGMEALAAEGQVKRRFKGQLYTGPSVMYHTLNSEIFEFDILDLDRKVS